VGVLWPIPPTVREMPLGPTLAVLEMPEGGVVDPEVGDGDMLLTLGRV